MTAAHTLEIELQLSLAEQQVAAFRRLMARRRSVPVRQKLRTVYFDTPNFALSERGIALRVRRAGRGWLQTLKTEGERRGGLSQRAEYEMAVDGGALDWSRFPAEALARVPEALREQVGPVFETRFERTAWHIRSKRGAQIEVALDVGEVRAAGRRQPICEVELELKAGQPDALFELAQGWAQQLDCLPLDISKAERGVRLAHGHAAEPVKFAPVALRGGMRVEEGFAAIVQACLAQFQANLPGVLGLLMEPLAIRPSPRAGKGANVMPKPMALPPLPNPLPQAGEGANVMPKPINGIEYVHQARVALRRLRVALRLYRGVCELPDDLMRGLRALAAALGPTRDWDVLCTETLPAIAPHFSDRKRWQQGAAVIEARRAQARAGMRVAVADAKPGAWLLACQRWLAQRAWRDVADGQRVVQSAPLREWARAAIKRRHRAIARRTRAFADLQPSQQHALRIAIKRQRYASEFFQGMFKGRRQARYQRVLAQMQDSLGRLNDAQVARVLLAPLEDETGGMAQFVMGWLAAASMPGFQADISSQLKDFMKCAPYW